MVRRRPRARWNCSVLRRAASSPLPKAHSRSGTRCVARETRPLIEALAADRDGLLVGCQRHAAPASLSSAARFSASPRTGPRPPRRRRRPDPAFTPWDSVQDSVGANDLPSTRATKPSTDGRSCSSTRRRWRDSWGSSAQSSTTSLLRFDDLVVASQSQPYDEKGHTAYRAVEWTLPFHPASLGPRCATASGCPL